MLSQLRAHKPDRLHVPAVLHCIVQIFRPQIGIGPSFSVVLIGLAIAKQVQATATTRTKVLTACRMAFSLHAGSLGAETLVGGIISGLSRGKWQDFAATAHFGTGGF